MNVKKSSLANIFVFLFLFRGATQALYSVELFNDVLYLHIGSLGLLMIYILLYLNQMRKLNRLNIEHIYILLFFVYCITISVFRSYLNYTDLINYILPTLIFSALFSIKDYISYKFIIKVIALIFLLQIIILVVNSGVNGFVQREGRGMLGSLFGHANSLALMAACFVLIKQNKIPGNALRSKQLVKNLFAITLIALIGARSMLLSVLIGFSFWALVKGKLNRFTIFLNFAVFSALTYLIVSYGFTLAAESWQEQSYTSGNSLKWRIIHWQYYVYDFNTSFDLFFGFGVGAHETVTSHIYNKYLEVHNDFIRIVYDIGIVGLFFYLVSDLIILSKIKVYSKIDWRIYLVFSTKYFFMFFDNYVTNLLSISGMMLICILYLKDNELDDKV